MIKKYLEFYYNIKYIDKIIKNNNIIFFNINNNNYYFMPTYINEDELLSINSVIGNIKSYDQFVINKYGKIVTTIDNIDYVLIKKSNNMISIENTILSDRKILPFKFNNYLVKTNWNYLWSRKIDYIVNRLNQLDKKNSTDFNVIVATWYFISLSEIAISYIYPLMNNNTNINLYISHKRINNNFNSPLNIILDYKERDISEYLKYLFISGDYNYQDIEEFINKSGINNSYSAELVYGRMLFPTEYFDRLDNYLSNNDLKIIELIKRIDEYEKYLSNIYIILSKKNKVREVDWI